jgi:hypothetical protein
MPNCVAVRRLCCADEPAGRAVAKANRARPKERAPIVPAMNKPLPQE